MKVAARALVEWVCRRGDIHARYDGATDAEEGISTQRRIQRRRGPDYLCEQRVTARFRPGRSVALEVGGRIDGLERRSDAVLVEEIKTTREDPVRLYGHAGALHFAQLRLYAAMLARDDASTGLPPPPCYRLRLVYCNPDTDVETAFEETADRDSLACFFDDVCRAFLRDLLHLRRHRRSRDRALRKLAFPFAPWRPAQRLLATAVYRAIRDRGAVLAEAPTGSGKTLGTLFPALRAAGEGLTDRIVYLSARGTGQLTAAAAAATLAAGAAQRLRAVTLTAKHKICFKAQPTCDPESCEYARGYYDRRGAAVADLSRSTIMDRARIEDVAARHTVCPFELSLDASAWSDLVICDYNYVFDPVVRLKRVRGVANDRTTLLVDEAHQLAPRVKDVLSTRLERRQLTAARAVAPEPTARAIRALERRLTTLCREHPCEPGRDAAAIEAPPAALDRAIERTLDAISDGEAGSSLAPELHELTFALSRWLRVRTWYDVERFATLLTGRGRHAAVELRCLDPSAHIGRVLGEFDSHVRFSGTLGAPALFARLHGCEADALRLPSPFPPERLGVFVVPDVSVRYRNRQASLDRLTDTIATLTAARSGNYLVALPSFDYLDAVCDRFSVRHPEFAVVRQRPDMDPPARDDFLAHFLRADAPIVGFVVLGGVFAESIDLRGDRLIGVLVAGIGLPPPSVERELEHAAFGAQGRLIAYLHPAVSRVVQAAGRIIRDASDRGVVCLVDDRYASREYRSLLPAHWQIEVVGAGRLRSRLDVFWQNG